MQYVRALKESGCKYFLYENNYSIHKDIKAFISEQLGVEHIMINSALVSAQSRKRCYWTNIPNVTQPEDKGLLLEDILESDGSIAFNTINGKSHCMTASYYKAGNTINSILGLTFRSEGGRQRVAAPIRLGQYGKGGQGQRIYSVRGKSVTLSTNSGGQGAKTGLYKIDLPDGDYTIRKLTPIEAERLQTLPDNYTEGVSDTQRYKCIGNGWTVDVISHILKYLESEVVK